MSDTQNSGGGTVEISESEYSLDSILVRIGQFGKFQLVNYTLICVSMLFNAVASLTYVFTTSPVVHRCNISECDTPTSGYYEEWMNFTIPFSNDGFDQCKRFVSISNQSIIPADNADNGLCFESNFDRNMVESCENDLKFRDREFTISNEFGIFCSNEWKLSMVGEANNIGQLFGVPIGGYLSDRYGRRNILATGGLLAAIFGLMRSFSPNYNCILLFEFLENVASSTLYATCFIIAIELVGPKRRNFACSLISFFYPLGEALLALIAKYTMNWRTLLRILYAPALIHVLYYWILPESVRWLLSQGEEEKAADILRSAAVANKRKLSESHIDKLILSNRDKLLSYSEDKFPIRQTFDTLFWRICNCSLCWFANTLVYFGLNLNASSLDGNKYNNFIYISLIEIPAILLSFLIMDRIGRRYSLFGCMLVSGICSGATVFLASHQSIWNLVIYLIDKMAISASFQILYFLTSELFPTNIRSSMLSFCSIFGRFGSMLAALTPLMGKYYANGPVILFSSFAVLSAFTSLLFPETTNTSLPATTKEACNIDGKKQVADVELTHL